MQVESVAPQLGEESIIHALGRDYTVGRLSINVWEYLLQWARPRIITPLDHLKSSGVLKDLPPAEALQLVREELRHCPTVLSVMHPLFMEVIDNTVEGSIERYYYMLRIHHPDITRDTVADILREIGQEEAKKTIVKANGKLPPKGKKKGAVRHDAAGDEPGGSAEHLAPNHLLPLTGNPPAPAADPATDPDGSTSLL